MIPRPLAAALLALGLVVTASAEAPDPQALLFMTEARVAEMRQAIARPRTHHAEAFAAMKARVDEGSLRPYEPGFHADNNAYLASWRAREAAMLYRLTGDRRYAQAAIQSLREHTRDAGTSGSGLARAQTSAGHAIAYNWAGEAWSAEDRRWVEDRMKTALDAWPRFGHPNLGHSRGSNWVAVTRGGELILLLGAGEQVARADRLNFLVRELERHIQSGYGSIGMSQEGVGYMSYGASFLFSSALALESRGDSRLTDRLRRIEPWKSLMFAGAFSYTGRHDDRARFLQSGVAGGNFYEEGWASLTLGLAPEEVLPYVVHWYDRHTGVRNPRPPAIKYDSHRAGTTFALIYYPERLESRDPTGAWPPAVGDNRGYYFFRNRFADANDIQISVMADTNHHSHAWNQPEATAINVLAFGNHFIAGPATEREPQYYSTLHVDGQNNRGGNDTGERILFEPDDRGGYVIVGGGRKYAELGLSKLHRHARVDFTVQPSTAVFSTLDLIEADGTHTYTWNANVGPRDDDEGIRVASAQEGGRPAFLLTGANQGYVKGWVLHPADARIEAEAGRLQIHTRGQNAQIWVAMAVGQGTPPAGAVQGQGLQSVLQVGQIRVRYDAEAERIRVDRP